MVTTRETRQSISLFYNEQSGRKNSGTFRSEHPSAACDDGFLCKHAWLCRRLMGGPWSPKILYPEWQHQYQAALAEIERKKLLERVTAAETAIFNRIQAISPEYIAERQAIEDALANLRVLRRDNLGLPVKAR